MNPAELRRVPSDLLLTAVRQTLVHERRWMVDFLATLSEIDARRLYLMAGAPDLFRYLVEKLGIAEPSASKRIAAARVMRRFPAAGSMLLSGETHLSGIYLVAKRLNDDNASSLLESLKGKTRNQVEEQMARLFPEEEKRPWVRPLPPLPSAAPPIAEVVIPDPRPASSPAPMSPPLQTTAPLFSTAPSSAIQAPLGEGNQRTFLNADAIRLAVTVQRETYDILERLVRLSPGQPLAKILHDAVCLLEQKKNPALRAERAQARTVHVREPLPAALRHQIFNRDKAQCTFVGPDSVRCPARENLHIDHIIPVAKGGTNHPANLRLRCAGHNLWGAIEEFGLKFMNEKMSEK
jgi:5-methylcytosine-specific restriction endonuclease McrA